MELFKMFGEFGVKGVKEAESDIRSLGDTAVDEFRDIEKAADRAGEGIEDALDEGSGSVEGLSGKLGKLSGALGALGVGAAIGGMNELIDASKETIEDMGKLEAAFTSAGHSSETAQSVLDDMVGVLGEYDQSVEAANHLAKLTQNTEELSKWGDIAAGVYATFGDSLPLEGLTEAANETAKVGQVTGPLADALNWAGVSEDEFNEKLAACNDEQERASLITETLSGLYQEAADTYQDVNGELIESRQAQADLSEAMAKLGEALMPIQTAFVNLAATLLEKLSPALDFLMEHMNVIGPVLLGAAAGAAALAVALNMGAIVTACTTALNTAKTAVLGLNAAMSANPIGIVIGLLVALGTALVTLYMTNEDFRNKVLEVWNTVKTAAGAAWDFVTGKFEAMKATLLSVATALHSGLSGTFESIKSTAGSIFEGIKTGITEKIEGAKNAVKSAIDKIKGFFNFSWSLPKLKLPHISISGKFSLSPLQVPKFSISWYKKAMDEAMVLDDPTIFGFDSESGRFLGGGEAGREVVSGEAHLMGLIKEAVGSSQGISKGDLTAAFIEAVDAAADKLTIVVQVGDYEVARATASANDRVSGSRQLLTNRGLARA